MIVTLPQPELSGDWKEWAAKLTQELQSWIDTMNVEQGVDGIFTSVDGKTIEVRAGLVAKVR